MNSHQAIIDVARRADRLRRDAKEMLRSAEQITHVPAWPLMATEQLRAAMANTLEAAMEIDAAERWLREATQEIEGVA
jgi:hypothetical protein